MYAWLWRKLPGRTAAKAAQSVVLVAAVCLVLMAVVFPWVEPRLPFSENTVDGSGGSVAPTEQPTAVPTGSASSTSTAVPAPPGGGLAGE